jgi:hypothetical protein
MTSRLRGGIDIAMTVLEPPVVADRDQIDRGPFNPAR